MVFVLRRVPLTTIRTCITQCFVERTRLSWETDHKSELIHVLGWTSVLRSTDVIEASPVK
jgi:hypothetical protein